MSHHQSRGDRSDSQQRRSSRPARPSVASPLPSQAASSKRYTGGNGQPRGHSPASHESDNHRAQQSASQYQGQPHGSGIRPSPQPSNGSMSRAFRPVTPSSSESTPVIPKPADSAWSSGSSQVSFQFGSIGVTTYLHTGIQIPARTSSAPPNLDEQKQDQTRYGLTSTNAAGTKAYGSAQRPQVQQSGGPQQSFRPKQPPTPLSSGIPQSPYIQNQAQHHTIQANSHVQVQSNSQHMQMQGHLVPSQAQQQGLVQIPFQPIQFQQSMGGSQMLGPQLGPIPGQLPPHQIPGALPTPLPPGMPTPHYGMFPPQHHFIQQRTSKAVKIVHPETHEELKFDSKSLKNAENSFSTMTTAASQGRMTGHGSQIRPSLGYASSNLRHINQNTLSQQNGPYVPGSQNYNPSTVPFGTGHTRQKTNEALHDQPVSSPHAHTDMGNADVDNVGVGIKFQNSHAAQPTFSFDDRSKISENIDKESIAPDSDIAGEVKKNPIDIEEGEITSKAQSQGYPKDGSLVKEPKDNVKSMYDAVNVQEPPNAAQEAQPDHVSIRDGAKSHKDMTGGQESKESQEDAAAEPKTHKDITRVQETKESQEDAASLKSAIRTDTFVPEVRQGGKKKKKKDSLSKAHVADGHKVSKAQLETKRQIQGKTSDAYNLKSLAPKPGYQTDNKPTAPSEVKEEITSEIKFSESKAVASVKSGVPSEAILESPESEMPIPVISESKALASVKSGIAPEPMVKLSESEGVIKSVIHEVALEAMVKSSESGASMHITSEIGSEAMDKLSESDVLIPAMSEAASEALVISSESDQSEAADKAVAQLPETEAFIPMTSEVPPSESQSVIPVILDTVVPVKSSADLAVQDNYKTGSDILETVNHEQALEDSTGALKTSTCNVSLEIVMDNLMEDNAITNGSTEAIEISMANLNLEPMVSKPAEYSTSATRALDMHEISKSEEANISPTDLENLEVPSQNDNQDDKLVIQVKTFDVNSFHSDLQPSLDTSSNLESAERLQPDDVINDFPPAIGVNIQTSKDSQIRGIDTCVDTSVATHGVKLSVDDINTVGTVSLDDNFESDQSKPAEDTKIRVQVVDVSKSVHPLDITNDDDASKEMQINADIKPEAKKKKMKDILAKADAAGPNADLYNAYNAPKENKTEITVLAGGTIISQTSAAEEESFIAEEITAPNELDDWEDAAEIPTPAPNSSVGAETDSSSKSEGKGPSNHKAVETYSRDFLLTFKDQNTGLPLDFDLRPEISDLLIPPSQQSPRIPDRQLGGSSRRTMFEDDRWAKPPQGLHSPAWPQSQGMQSPGWSQPQGLHSPVWPDNYMDFGFPSGFRSGGAHSLIPRMPSNVRPGISLVPMSAGLIVGKPLAPSPGMMRSNTADSDRWQRIPPVQKGLIPSPQTPAPNVHKAEHRYEVGKVSDEEEIKQRQIKGILNKLTPQNFDKLFGKVKDVQIQSAVTLNGVISQIFDKALTEPTFCEMYAKFCKELASALPEFVQDDEKITFKRVLLNKCQEAFERGEREEAEAAEEGNGREMTAEEREAKRIEAKKRMLGNIRFIGELYKKHMLTERIMHGCIVKLLGELNNPEEEDIEALCKLVSTIGHMIDQEKAKHHMDAYFERMELLSSNLKLSSRIRFMLKDVIDLRMNDWQVRRKVDGPKKIEEVHKDAVQERQATVAQAGRFSRAASVVISSGRRTAPVSDSGMRGSSSHLFSPTTPIGGAQSGGLKGNQPPTSGRGTFVQDVRVEERLFPDNRPAPIPLAQRSVDDAPITLGPHGGLGRGPWRSASASKPAYNSSASSGSERPGTPPERPEKYGILNRPDKFVSSSSDRYPVMLERTLSDKAVSTPASLPTHHQQQASKASGAPLFMPVDENHLKEQSKSALVEYFSARDQKEVIQCIEDLKAPHFYPTMVYTWISLVLEKKETERELFISLLISLCKSEPFLLKHDQVFQAFEMAIENLEDIAMDVPKAPLYLSAMIKKLTSEGVLSAEQVSTLIKATDLIPDLDITREESNKETSLDVQHLEQQFAEHLNEDGPVLEMQKWLEQNITPQMQSDSSFLRMIMTQVLRHAIPSTFEKEQHQSLVKERLSRYKTLLRRFAMQRDKQSQYILAMQLFIHSMGHPPGLMTTLCSAFYDDEVISESAYVKWEDDVKDTTAGREQALRDVFRWLIWLKTAPEQS